MSLCDTSACYRDEMKKKTRDQFQVRQDAIEKAYLKYAKSADRSNATFLAVYASMAKRDARLDHLFRVFSKLEKQLKAVRMFQDKS